MRLRALLDSEALGLRLLGGADELDRTVRGVMTTDLTDPGRYLSGGELVLTGLAWRHGPEDSEPFVRILAAAGVAGLAAGEAELSGAGVPEDLVRACARHRLPLFAVDEDVAFATITEHVVRQVSGERAGDLAAVVERHRRLMSAGPAGGGPDVVLDLLGSDLDLRAWVLSPTGRQIAGTVPGAGGAGGAGGSGGSGGSAGASAPAGGRGPALPAQLTARLAGEHLAALRAGRPGPHRVTPPGTGVTYSLFPVGGGGRDVRETVLSDWLLAVEADAGEWPPERLDLLHGVTQLIAVERERRDAARTVPRRLAQEVLELVQAGAQPAEIAARLRMAVPVLLPGAGAAPQWQVVVARVEWETPYGRPGIAGGPVAQALLEEMLAGPEREPADRIAVAAAGDEAVALLPLPARAPARPEAEGRTEDADDTGAGTAQARARSRTPAGARASAGTGSGSGVTVGAAGLRAEALLAAVREPLARGLADDGRLTLGVSAAVHSPEGLRGALEEARHARRVAAARPGSVCAAGHEELASHVLLLPFVPDDVRRAFTARLLDPLRAYDHRHRAELVETLAAFLDCDGSWTRCAARLHLHVNTLRYRVGRIEQLTGRDLSRLENKLDFFLALRMS